VDSVTGTINNKTLYLECLVKEEPVDSELDAEVAYHTDKSFSSQTSDNITFHCNGLFHRFTRRLSRCYKNVVRKRSEGR
jgi:hypothetical protein